MNYEKISLTTDNIIVRCQKESCELQVLLVKRKDEPFSGRYALVGGFVQVDESDVDASIKTVFRKTGLTLEENQIEQLKTYSVVDRDPRWRTVSITNISYIPYEATTEVTISESETTFEWVKITPEGLVAQGRLLREEEYAFDHHEMIMDFLNRMRGRQDYKPSFLKSMPPKALLSVYRKDISKFDESHLQKGQTSFNRKFAKFFEETDDTDINWGRVGRVYQIKKDLI